MPLDPMSALSVAAAVVQFIDYGTKVVSKGKKLYKSPDGALFENVELEAASCRLESLSRKMLASLHPEQLGALTEAETALENICHGCNEVSKILVSRLEDIQLPKDLADPDDPDGNNAFREKAQRKWHSFRQALKTVWSKKEIDEIANRLARLRTELDTHVLISLREQIQVSSLQHDKQFALVNRNEQEIMTHLLQDHEALQDMITQFKALSLWQEKEHEKTRNIFIAKAEERFRRKIQLGLLESLRFTTMKDRDEAITEAHQRTCEWIFREADPNEDSFPWSSFTEWLKSGDGIYCIHGKPGSGKSTLMRFVSTHPLTRTNLRHWAQGHIHTSAFYFWNSGAIEQRSQVGLFRSLLYNILGENMDLIPAVFPEEWGEYLELAKHDVPLTFKNYSLKRLLRGFTCLISQASNNSRFCFFIDGLDEFEGDHEELAVYFHQLSCSPFVKLCISSRPLTVFKECFKLRPSLRLQDLTASDIKRYIEDKLNSNARMKLLIRQSPDESVKLVEEVIRKAEGVFQWVSLVVKSLLKGLGQKDSILYLMKRIQKLPADLEHLYAYIISSIDPIYMEEASKVFQIYHAAELSIHEAGTDMKVVYHALTCNLVQALGDDDCVLCCTDPGFDSISEHMDTILRTRCGGLIEIHENEDRYYLSYIHHTVKEYLMQPVVWDSLLAHTSNIGVKNFDPDMALVVSWVLLFKTSIRASIETHIETSYYQLQLDYNSFKKVPKGVLIDFHWPRISFHARRMQQYNSRPLVQLLDEFDRAATIFLTMDYDRDLLKHWSNYIWPNLNTSFLSAACEAGICTYVKAKLESNLAKPEKYGAELLFQVFFLLENSQFDTKIFEVAEVLSEYVYPGETFAGDTIWSHWLILLCGLSHQDNPEVRRMFKSMIKRGANLDCRMRGLPTHECWKRRYQDCHDGTTGAFTARLTASYSCEVLQNSPESSNSVSLETFLKSYFKADQNWLNELLELIAKVKTAAASRSQSSRTAQKRKPAQSSFVQKRRRRKP